MKITHLFSATI